METKNTHGGCRPGAGRKKGGKNSIQKEKGTVFHFRLSKQELDILKSLAAARNMTVTAFIKSKVFFNENEKK